MRLLSIDPGSGYCGVALWESGYLVWAGILDPSHEGRYDCAKIGTKIVCERPQVYMSNLKVANDMITLALAAGEFVGRICAQTGASVVYVYPATWKGAVPKPKKKGWSPEDYPIARRARAALSYLEIEGIDMPVRNKKQQCDVWDAIGIGLFHLKRVGRGVVSAKKVA